MSPFLALDSRAMLKQRLRHSDFGVFTKGSKWQAWGQLARADWLEQEAGDLIHQYLGQVIDNNNQPTIHAQLYGPVRYTRSEIGITEESISDHSDYWNAHRFWRPLYAEGLRLFERNPPGESKQGFLYVRTIEDLTRGAVLPPRA